MNIESTLLALQIMDGVKIYDVRFVSIQTGKITRKSYFYKSLKKYEKGQALVVPTFEGESFGVGIVEEEVQDLDIESLQFPLRWVLFEIDDPMAARKAAEDFDKSVKVKLTQGRAKKAAKDYLEASGLTTEDIKFISSNNIQTKGYFHG